MTLRRNRRLAYDDDDAVGAGINRCLASQIIGDLDASQARPPQIVSGNIGVTLQHAPFVRASSCRLRVAEVIIAKSAGVAVNRIDRRR